MSRHPESLTAVFETLDAAFGPQHWWPAESPFEVVVGAVLVQNTNWNNVRRAIENLRDNDLLEPHALHRLPAAELEELIRPAGYFRVKARRLAAVIEFLVEKYDGSLDALFSEPTDDLRRALLEIHGVGPETADSILLYAGSMPTFVVDAYTLRIAARHGWVGHDTDYHQLQEFFESELPRDVDLYNQFHALLVRVGKDFCKKSKPNCDACPLRDMLPEAGPYEPD